MAFARSPLPVQIASGLFDERRFGVPSHGPFAPVEYWPTNALRLIPTIQSLSLLQNQLNTWLAAIAYELNVLRDRA